MKSKSKIDKYNLGETVIRLRRVYSLAETASIINQYHLEGDRVNAVTIKRWEDKHNLGSIKTDGMFIYGTNLDALGVLMDSYSEVKLNIEKIKNKLDQCESIPESALLFDSFGRAVSSMIRISLDMAKMQRQLHGNSNVKKFLATFGQIILDLDKEYPEINLKVKFVGKLKEVDILDELKTKVS